MTPDGLRMRTLKAGVFCASLLPAIDLAWRAARESLGPNPVEAIMHTTGDWTFNFLLITLAVTPLRVLGGWHWLLRLRRMLGLFAFAYGTLHLLAFAGFDHRFDLGAMLADVRERPFVATGFCGFALMLALAATSFGGAVRWLGAKRWKALHRAIYAIALLSALHYLWQAKITAILQPLVYTAMLTILIGWRVSEWVRRERHVRRTASDQSIRLIP
jgi:sulfoxide reductase heme-binding subunit YedZ